MNVILNPDRTRKNIVSVDETTARTPECPIDILPEDIFVENAPPIHEEMHTPQLSIDNLTWTEVNTVAAKDKKIQSKWQEIKSHRDRVKAGGVLVSTKWFHTDDASRIQQLGLVNLGASIPAGIMWKTMDGTFIEMTQQLAIDIFNAVTTLDITAFANAETHRGLMEVSATPETYDYSTGWPTIYMI